MYTERVRGKKILLQLTEEPRLLGTAVAAAVHGDVGGLRQLIIEYFHWDKTKDMHNLAELLLRMLGEIHIQDDEPTDDQRQIIERAAKELRGSQRQFRDAIFWLCSPKPSNTPINLKLIAPGKWEMGRYPHIDKRSENFVRYFETHGLRHFKTRLSLQKGRLLPRPRITHCVDLFCACLLDCCMGREASEIPFKVCPTCRQLFLSERKMFCSKDCQWKHYWTSERRADDKWSKDLEKFSQMCKPKYGRSIRDLQKRLSLPGVVERLESIKKKADRENWAGWSRIVKRLKAIEKLAALSDK